MPATSSLHRAARSRLAGRPGPDLRLSLSINPVDIGVRSGAAGPRPFALTDLLYEPKFVLLYGRL